MKKFRWKFTKKFSHQERNKMMDKDIHNNAYWCIAMYIIWFHNFFIWKLIPSFQLKNYPVHFQILHSNSFWQVASIYIFGRYCLYMDQLPLTIIDHEKYPLHHSALCWCCTSHFLNFMKFLSIVDMYSTCWSNFQYSLMSCVRIVSFRNILSFLFQLYCLVLHKLIFCIGIHFNKLLP